MAHMSVLKDSMPTSIGFSKVKEAMESIGIPDISHLLSVRIEPTKIIVHYIDEGRIVTVEIDIKVKG